MVEFLATYHFDDIPMDTYKMGIRAMSSYEKSSHARSSRAMHRRTDMHIWLAAA